MNIPQLLEVVNASKSKYEAMIQGEIRVVGLRQKILNRIETLNKVQTLLIEHQDVKKYETTCGECGEELEKDSMYGYCDNCI